MKRRTNNRRSLGFRKAAVEHETETARGAAARFLSVACTHPAPPKDRALSERHVAELKAALEKLPADRQDEFRRELQRGSGKYRGIN